MLKQIDNPDQALLDQLYAERQATNHQVCPDCGVKPGKEHLQGCDVAHCLNTGEQRLQCDCGECGKDIWTGMWPGVQECYDKKLICFDTKTKKYCFDLNRAAAMRRGVLQDPVLSGKSKMTYTALFNEEFWNEFDKQIKHTFSTETHRHTKRMVINVFECSGIELSIVRAYRTKKKRGWDRLYFSIDLHDTITRSTYTKDEAKEKAFFPGAIEALKYFSSRKGIILILNTASFPEYLKEYYRQFEENGIYFDYLNENPEVPSTDVGDFGKKFYFNILMDDKAGFNPLKDWVKVLELVQAFEEDEVYFLTQEIDDYLDFKIS